ncbi:MAG: hypothetical protein ACXWXH_09170 [Aeromicrobium sp.]
MATAAVAGESVTFDEAGRQLGCGAEELLLATRCINEAGAGSGRAQAIGLGEPAGSGSNGIGPRPYVLAEGLAQLLTPHL